MTATPRETEDASNSAYFGAPVYSYSLAQGIDDGFLAPFKVINIMTDIGDGWRPRKGQRDIYGNEIPDRIYTNSDYDYNIIIEDRIREVAREITRYLKSTDRMARTIVFCATEDAAAGSERSWTQVTVLKAEAYSFLQSSSADTSPDTIEAVSFRPAPFMSTNTRL